MPDIPRAVLSEHFQDRMKGRRLISAVFTTFRLEPGFFETEVLPVFFDTSLSHASKIKLVQLDDAIRPLRGSIAVYYDQHGLVAEGGPAKLDIRRFPIHHPTGIFHPKNVLALVESAEPDATGHQPRALLCACLSANLTRAGWWQNVEVAHVEEIAEGASTNLREPLMAFADDLIAAAERRRPNDELRQRHEALHDIREFLHTTSQRDYRSQEGRVRTQFHNQQSLPDFIENACRISLRGMCLEVISPYFDEAAESAPLATLLARFQPRETRVFLPKNDNSEALCPQELFAWVRAQPGVSWGSLPDDLLRLGKGKDVKNRPVHAKVYRFFNPVRGGREILYVGSTNLTKPGCRLTGRGGNWETGFIIDVTQGHKPDWWLSPEMRPPRAFATKTEGEGAVSNAGTQLVLQYQWNTEVALAFWGGSLRSPRLGVEHAGICILTVDDLPPREWVRLPREDAQALAQVLVSTSLLHVSGERPEPGLLLVQEEGMSHRPSLLLELSSADILRYWALLTVEQRAAFIEARATIAGDDDPLITRLAPLTVQSSLFDRFAGVFHAFGCVEERILEALEEGKTREVDYRLFGNKYDSFGTLLDRLLADVRAEKGDGVEHYVVTLCARQLLREVGRQHLEYWAEHRGEVKELEQKLQEAGTIRTTLAARNDNMPAFLDWFEPWFLKRAQPTAGEGEL